MSLPHILLGMLREPMTGYDVKKAFNEGARHFWSAELSQIYPTLQKMRARGWLRSRLEPSAKGPPRRVYRRTKKGTEALRDWLLSDPVMGTERFAYLGQLVYLGELDDLEATGRFLTELRERLGTFLRLVESAQAELRRGRSNVADDLDSTQFHELLAITVGVHSLRAKVAACDECLELLRARRAKETT
jgi:DNA-binding PadR family transcriptional regulator